MAGVTGLVMTDGHEPADRDPARRDQAGGKQDQRSGADFRRRRRGRNLAILGALALFVVVVYLVTIVKITSLGGG